MSGCTCGGTPPANVPLPTTTDLEQIGAALLNYVALVVQLGHTGPAETPTYHQEKPTDGFAERVVRDFTAWTANRGEWQAAECRLRHYITASGWLDASLGSSIDAIIGDLVAIAWPKAS